MAVPFLIAATLLLAACRPAGAVTAASDPGPASSVSSGSAGCDLTFGVQLRERTVVAASGRFSLYGGAMPCQRIGLWVARFGLDEDPVTDPAPTFVADYTGQPLTAQMAVSQQPCAASALFFALDATGAADLSQAVTAARLARDDLAKWPAEGSPTVPGGSILAGHGSVILAGSVGGDPSSCSPGSTVSYPFANAGDCWLASPDPVPVPDAEAEANIRFTKVSCNAQHTHEVYWVQALSPTEYVQDTKHHTLPASTWARERADAVCTAKGAAIELAHDVAPKDILLEFQWPSTLTYPPSPPTAWDRAQVVCLARWQDGKPSSRQLLRR